MSIGEDNNKCLSKDSGIKLVEEAIAVQLLLMLIMEVTGQIGWLSSRLCVQGSCVCVLIDK